MKPDPIRVFVTGGTFDKEYSALAFVQILPPGVYVAMNGRYAPWNAVRKNQEKGVFEVIERS